MKKIIVFLILLAVGTSCREKETKVEAPETTVEETLVTLTDEQMRNAGIATAPIEQKQFSSILKLNGRIDVPPQNTVSVSVPLGGYLKQTKLLPGMHVTKGEVIAVVEDQQYIQLQQDYLTAKAKINYLENEYLRQKELNTDKASSDKVYQQAEADFKTHQVLLTALKEKLSLAGIDAKRINENYIQRNITIHSPINGFVSKVNVNIGQHISPTQVMFELVNPSDIHLALTVFEKDLEKLSIGQKLVAFTNNNPDKKYKCEILLIGRDLSNERNTEVHCHFNSYDKSLVPGTYMNAEIEVTNNKAYVLPAEAIVRYEGRNFIYRVRGKNQFEQSEVKIGGSYNGLTELELADPNQTMEGTFVTRGAYSLLMTMKNKSE